MLYTYCEQVVFKKCRLILCLKIESYKRKQVFVKEDKKYNPKHSVDVQYRVMVWHFVIVVQKHAAVVYFCCCFGSCLALFRIFGLHRSGHSHIIMACLNLRIDAFSFRVSVSRRTFGPGNILVHAWFGASPQLTKCIWCMAVAQHQFYLDRKHNKVGADNPCPHIYTDTSLLYKQGKYFKNFLKLLLLRDIVDTENTFLRNCLYLGIYYFENVFFGKFFLSIDTKALNDLSVLVEDLIYIGSIQSARKGSIA